MSSRTLRRSTSSKNEASTSLQDSGISISEDFSVSGSSSSSSSRSSSTSSGDSDYRDGPRRKISLLDRDFSCHICNKNFMGRTDLRRHLLIHSDEKPHKCHICPKSYRQEVNLRNHIKSMHGSKSEFICGFCRKTFHLKARLNFHLPSHTGPKPYSCPKCPKHFANGTQLTEHIATHDEGKKKRCKICSTSFSSEENLRLHMERHKQGKSHACQFCKKIFPTGKLMRVHLHTAHAKETTFDCQLCEKKIKGDVQTHMKMHAKPKPFRCEECKAEFNQKIQYIVHKRRHTGERPFQCRVCWSHFGHANVLKLHIRKHTGEKPFKCLLCKEPFVAFSQLSHLKTHMKSIHQIDKAYTCEGCKECFKVKLHLDNHMITCEKLLLDKIEPLEVDIIAAKDAELLSRLRYLMAVLIKKISKQEKLNKLGFEKRLIDNVLIASLKVANRKCYDCPKMKELDRMKLNIQEFLEWIVPAEIMDTFKKECSSIESILDKIVTMYLNKVK